MGGMWRWVANKIGLYLFLILSIIAASLITPIISETRQTSQRATILQNASDQISQGKKKLKHKLRHSADQLHTTSLTELRQQRRQLITDQGKLEKSIRTIKPAWVLAISDPQALLTAEQQKLRLAWTEQQLAAVNAALDLMESQEKSVTAALHLPAQQNLVDKHRQRCTNSSNALQSYELRWSWRIRQWFESPDHQILMRARDEHCDAYESSVAVLRRMQQARKATERLQAEKEKAFQKIVTEAAHLERAGEALSADAARAQMVLSGTTAQKLGLWADHIGLRAILWQALLLLALIIATPLMIRLISFYILAPLAMRRPFLRLTMPEAGGKTLKSSAKSAVSISIILKEGEELLVRQNYLQSSSQRSEKSTRWLLDKNRPFTSFAAGLSFLTRIIGHDETTILSAVQDGFSEVTKLELEDGAACVLQPRALAAVVQPIGRPVLIRSHWRLFSLNAWLTLQLRYLVFHGPAQLILKGGRGVRVEGAQAGRIFGQDQLVGFSTDLAYSVARTETFWPYFLGREPLLKDRVLAGEGMLIIEEAPQSSRTGQPRRGLEGMVDAVLKIFGI